VVHRLLASRVDVDAQNRAGDTALILATRAGDVDAVAALLAAGAKRQLRNRDGVAAVDAAKELSFDAVAALVR
jgi:ankyrin repeat protein